MPHASGHFGLGCREPAAKGEPRSDRPWAVLHLASERPILPPIATSETRLAFIFYDTETTGTAPAFDQILQFAAIQTDEQLNELATIDTRCRILPWVVPSPKALLVTGVRPAALLTAARSHLEMITLIRQWLLERSPSVLIGHNSIKFDETMLRQAFYQTLHPVYLTNTNGNRRGDTMRLAQATAIFSPGSITVPISAKGRPTFKLGDLARANGIPFTEEEAHDALADVRATVQLARLLRDRAPAIWEQMLINASKHGAIEFMKSKTAFCLGEVSFGNLSSSLVTAVALNAGNSGQMAVFDLAYRPDAYLDLSVEALVEVLNGREPAIRVVAANNQPIIVDTRIGHALIEASTFGRETLAEHALQIRAADAFRQRVAQALTLRFEEKAPSAYAERRIYDGFPHRADERLMQQFHQADWTERHGLCGRFDDLRYAEFGLKLLYAERPDALPPDVRHDVERHIRERLLAEGDDVPWLTLAGALAAIAALRADGEDAGLLDEIEQFVQQMRRHVLATAA